jgi:hypothetical protein
MVAPASLSVSERLDQLRVELADLAFELERQGRLDAADIANQIRLRIEQPEDVRPDGRGGLATRGSNFP